MFRVSLVLFYIILSVFYVNGQAVRNNFQGDEQKKSGLVIELKAEIDKVNEEKIDLSKQQLQMESLIDKTKQQCLQEIGSLNQTLHNFQLKANLKQKMLTGLLKKIQNEEEVHIILEVELKKLSEALELLEFQHDVIIDDSRLLKYRRENKTNIHCAEVITAVEGAGGTQSRSASRLIRRRKSTPLDLQIKVQQAFLKTKLNERNKLMIALTSAKTELKSSIDKCEMKKSNLQALTSESSQALETSIQSASLLESDLIASVVFTEAVRLEIITAKNFITGLRARVNEIKSSFRQYSEDVTCYTKLKKTLIRSNHLDQKTQKKTHTKKYKIVLCKIAC